MKKIKLFDALSIGIGGMVGGGIFAVLGLAVSLAKGATPLAFIVAGMIAFLTAISYSKLSLKYPSKGGTVTFINKVFGKNIFSGGTNNLLWISYIIMLSLYASAFGSYAPNLFSISSSKILDQHFYASMVIIIATAINYYSVATVSKIEKYAVLIKLLILGGFIVIGGIGLFGSEHLIQLTPTHFSNPTSILIGGMVIFVAYEGFELIANVSPNIENPKKNIPLAFLGATGFVIVLYVLIAIITVGSLSFDTIHTAEDYVLAEAAKPLLGKIGFTIITIAALISTFSAINASLYGGSRVNYELAEDDEMPHELTKYMWNQPIGLLITAVLTFIITNTLDLTSISTSGSAGFLLIFTIVNFAAYKKFNKVIHLVSAIICLVSFISLLVQQWSTNQLGTIVAISIITISFVLEWLFKSIERRKKYDL